METGSHHRGEVVLDGNVGPASVVAVPASGRQATEAPAGKPLASLAPRPLAHRRKFGENAGSMCGT